MRRAWAWYWRTIRKGWAEKDARQRRIIVWVMLGGFAFYAGLTAVIAFLPKARGLVLLAVVVLLPAQSIVTAIIRARRKRGDSN